MSGPPASPTLPVVADLLAAVKAVGWAVLPVLVGATVLVAVFALGGTAGEESGSLADWLRLAIVLLGLGLGGRLVAEGSFDSGFASAGGQVSVRVLPFVVAVLVLGSLVRSARRAEQRSPSSGPGHLVGRSALVGLVTGVLLLVLAVVGRTSSAFGADLGGAFDSDGAVSVGLGPVGVWLGATVLAGSATGLARWAVIRRRARERAGAPAPAPSRTAAAMGVELGAVTRVLRTFVLGLALVGLVAVLGYGIQQLATGEIDGDEAAGVLGLFLVLCVNVVAVAALGLLGVPVSYGAQAGGGLSGVGSGELLAGTSESVGLTDEPLLLLVLLVPVLLVLATSVRRTVRGRQLPLTPAGVPLAAVVGVVGGLALALLARVWVSGSATGAAAVVGSGSGLGSASAGPSLLWAPLLGGVWAALCVWAVRFGPTLALSSPRWLVRAVAGRALHPQWAAAVARTGPAPAGRPSAAVRAGLVGIGAAALLVVLGGVVLAVVRATVLSPENAAEEHLEALAAADVAAVLGDDEADLGELLLSPEVLDGDAFTPIADAEVQEVDEYGSSASARVSYTVDGETVEQTLYLDREEGLWGGWTVDPSLPTVYVDETDLGVQAGGVPIDSGEQRALPGRYVFGAVDDDVLTADDVAVALGGDYGYADVYLDPQVRDEITDQVTQAVEAVVADCATRTELPLEGCPFLGSNSYVPGDLTVASITVSSLPTWELYYDSYSGELSIYSDYDGAGVLTGTQPPYSFSDDQTPRPYEREFDFSVDGEVLVDGDEVTIEFSGY